MTAPPKYHCSVTALETDEDWQVHGPRIEQLESRCPPSLWLNTAYYRAVLAFMDPPPRCWFVEIADSPDAPPFAGAVFREETFRRSTLKPRALRPFDDVFFMVIPFFLAMPGREGDALEGMAQAVKRLARASHCDIVMLRRVREDLALAWAGRLAAHGYRPQIKPATLAPFVSIPDDFDSFLADQHGTDLRDVRMQRRRIRNRWKTEAITERFKAAELDDAAYARILERFEALRAKTWQHQWETESPRVDHERQRASYRAVFDIWRRRGALDFCFVTVAGQDAAFMVAVRDTDRVWDLLTGFAPEFRSYSMGKVAFIEAMRAHHAEGFRRFELGGEVIGWKAAWATAMPRVASLEFPTGSWKGLIW
nr:GNAT family N-acetyltransferase [Candidatus Brocadiia bacterium]